MSDEFEFQVVIQIEQDNEDDKVIMLYGPDPRRVVFATNDAQEVLDFATELALAAEDEVQAWEIDRDDELLLEGES